MNERTAIMWCFTHHDEAPARMCPAASPMCDMAWGHVVRGLPDIDDEPEPSFVMGWSGQPWKPPTQTHGVK